ncbi:hypothetical protein QWY85_12685 [Neolewinella lacunae]|uniref:Polysaccharide biosynthesis protein C-terminal domain-containing protein n=1 Tax=Neolewinella lacunae TaxID=1517758 RepID=A0A923PL05_9BACT|nr:hypothetical protein [Neolewinella lacunae]MBC6993616.1 hypothetical protein [Neolewinella lacunae]MDN3635522.1 hypothetical protein [Neolewinella lacunae]
MSKSLIRAGQFAQVARQAALIGVALVLPRLGIGREVIGQWESLLFLGYIISFGWLTGLLQGYLLNVRLTRPAEAQQFSRLAIGGVAGFSALLLLVAAALHEPLFRLLRLGEAPPGWGYFFLFLLAQWPGLFFEQVLVVRGKASALAVFSGLSALGLALSILVPLYYGANLVQALLVLAVFSGGKGFVLLLWWLRDAWQQQQIPQQQPGRLEKHDPGLLKSWLTTSYSLILYASAGTLVTAFDPWFVNYWYAGDEAIFAIFRYGARELPLLAAVVNGTMVVVLPRLTEDISAGLDLLKSSSRRLFHWVFSGAILLMLSSPWWWTIVFTEVFADSLPLFRVYLFLVVSRLLFPMPVVLAFGFTRRLYLFSLSELVSNIILSLILVPFMGLMGVVVSTVIADILNKVVLIVYLKIKAEISLSRYVDVRTFAVYSLLLMVAYVLF